MAHHGMIIIDQSNCFGFPQLNFVSDLMLAQYVIIGPAAEKDFTWVSRTWIETPLTNQTVAYLTTTLTH